MFKVVVTGSREWKNARYIHDAFKRLSDLYGTEVEIINGTARGADQMCAEIADNFCFTVTDVPANWNRYGKSAGYRRNVQMLEMEPDLVLAFWDGTSKGTKHTIDEARRRGLKVCVCMPQGWER